MEPATVIPPNGYDILIVDPPWQYAAKNKMKNFGDKVAVPYSSLSETALIEMAPKVNSVASSDCAIFMWATGAHLQTAINVMNAWGFQFVTNVFVWDKVNTNPGAYTLPQYEFVLLGKRGRVSSVLKLWGNTKQKLEEPRGKHSAKPSSFWKSIDKLRQENAVILEMFARTPPILCNHHVWGNEVFVSPPELSAIFDSEKDEDEDKAMIVVDND